jgi:hypothetical protein
MTAPFTVSWPPTASNTPLRIRPGSQASRPPAPAIGRTGRCRRPQGAARRAGSAERPEVRSCSSCRTVLICHHTIRSGSGVHPDAGDRHGARPRRRACDVGQEALSAELGIALSGDAGVFVAAVTSLAGRVRPGPCPAAAIVPASGRAGVLWLSAATSSWPRRREAPGPRRVPRRARSACSPRYRLGAAGLHR